MFNHNDYVRAYTKRMWDALTPTQRREKNRANYQKRKLKQLNDKLKELRNDYR